MVVSVAIYIVVLHTVFLVVEEQDPTWLGQHLNLTLRFISKAHDNLCFHTRNFRFTEHFPRKHFPVCLTK